MGRCPEDGQTVFFEASEDDVVDFFLEVETPVFCCRIAHVCGTVYAIYTPEVSDAFQNIAREASRLFDESYYEIVCDESKFMTWRNEQVWLADLPSGREGKRMIAEMESHLFQ